MLTRRELLAGTLTALLLPAERARSAGEELLALPGKRPLIKRTFRPPNYETPLADLRRPITANDAFFVRYHLANIPRLDLREWRLRVGGGCAQRAWTAVPSKWCSMAPIRHSCPPHLTS